MANVLLLVLLMLTSNSSSTSLLFPFPFPVGFGFGLSGAAIATAARRVSKTSGLVFAGVAPVIDLVALGVIGLGLLMLANISVDGTRVSAAVLSLRATFPRRPLTAFLAGPAAPTSMGVSPGMKFNPGPVAFAFSVGLVWPPGPTKDFDRQWVVFGLGVGVAGPSSEDEDSFGAMILVKFSTGRLLNSVVKSDSLGNAGSVLAG